MPSSPITSWQIEGEKVKAVTDFIFLGSKFTADSDCSHEIQRRLLLRRKLWHRHHIKKHRHYFDNKGPYSQRYGFSSSHVWMWELDHKASWALKNWCFQVVVLEKALESSLNSKEIKPVNPKGNLPWLFIGKTSLNLKLQYFGHLMQKSDPLENTPKLGRLKAKEEGSGRGWDG